MPVRRVNYTIAATDTLEIFTAATSSQTLEALSVRLVIPGTEPNAAKAQIGITQQGAGLPQRLIVLASGWLGPLDAVSWSGSIQLAPDFDLYCALMGTANIEVQLGAILYDYVHRPLKNETPRTT